MSLKQQQKPLNQIPASDADRDMSSLADGLGGSGARDPSKGDEELTNVGGQGEDLRSMTALHQPSFFSDTENQVALYRGIMEVST
jgi:hypothetical protein